MFFNMYSFTKFIIFVTATSLFTNTILLEHGYLYQRIVHRLSLTPCVSLLPCTFHFQVIHRLPSNHTLPACGVVPKRHSTIGDGFIEHKALNREWWFLNTAQVCHRGGGGGVNTWFSSLHCETWMWNIKILMGPLGVKKHYFLKQGLRQPFQNAVPHKAVLKTVIFHYGPKRSWVSADHSLKAA